ncbi:MAG: D-glycero-beta-D-manno-heptose-7-phosphate kinase [Candidatus Brocadiae bacterium]|nr:D-glycero-beta-D-manno-heptose-7-phosphate kinase [Candidatus Brocadiia bacterium]
MSIQSLIQSFSNYKILVIGDIILDHYAFGTVNRISPEAPIQILDLKKDEFRLGGAANVARNLAKLNVAASLCGVIGKDFYGSKLLELLDQDKIQRQGICEDDLRPSTIKTRFIANGHHLLRVDFEDKKAISLEKNSQIMDFLTSQINNYDCLILSDYAKGVFGESSECLAQKILLLAAKHGKKVFVGPKGKDWRKYKGAYLLSANRSETEAICGTSLSTHDDIKREAKKILEELELHAMLVTLGSQGMYLLNRNDQGFYASAQAKEVFDVVGAGDTVLSLISLCLAAGETWEMAMKLANTAAGIVVGKVGTSVVLPDELEKNFIF